MSNMILQCKETGDFKPHPEGIYVAVCNDVIDLGIVETEFQGQKRNVQKMKVSFETELKMEDGRPFSITKNFTAILQPKQKLAEFLGKWRGRPVMPGESIDLGKLIGACCTLVISHQKNLSGKTYAAIEAVSKQTKKIALSGSHDPVKARQRVAEWQAKQQPGASARPQQAAPAAASTATPAAQTKSSAPVPAPKPDYDPEVGF